ncbi:MAG: hypothetical protein HOY79_17785 [Streptomyces sp.]|nr:hypothetical protein [Streptomyces sp.]
MTEPMSNEQTAHDGTVVEAAGSAMELLADSDVLDDELTAHLRVVLAELGRLWGRESALIDELDAATEKGRRTGAELGRCADLNRDLVAENTNLAEVVKEAREQIRDRDYVNANLRKSVEEYRVWLAETGLEWGVRAAMHGTGRTEDVSQPSEESARTRVARSGSSSVLICRTKAGPWREAERMSDHG